ncbi:cell wall-active antibiotics response protein LiaF [Tumebacillus permanentifrigoris]|uniref:Cell wall-active antibiotic response 4TMS protein YvqF n=1 Tax=Tumebacillus permanentifrigoris TaxID=378543 RepID=A0A316D3F2_9BACL|nr:cell wall-active antibiotics response protein LiaF [Tumebacillus permanentifrigoris]PWK05953.1 cell wall-active antibiotic response 4TMS protein YvqF [Tumebacillus permanentifrigoris]
MRFWGALLLGVGAVMALVNFGVWEGQTVRDVFHTFWPAIIIYFSLIGWIGDVARRAWFGMVWNTVGIAGGAMLLLNNLGLLSVSWAKLLVPGALIVFGFLLLFGKSGGRKARTSIRYADPEPLQEPDRAPDRTPDRAPDRTPVSTNKISLKKTDHVPTAPSGTASSGPTATLTSSTPQQATPRIISNQAGDLRIGGANWKLETSRIMMRAGTICLDLRDTFIPEGETTLDIECKAGDIDIFLPDGLDVLVESKVKLGSNRVLDQRNANGTLYYKSNGYEEADRKVRLHILVKFGDIHVARVG